MIDDASTAPSKKKVKMTPDTDTNGKIIAMEESVDMTDQSEYVQAKGVVAQDQVYSHTVLLQMMEQLLQR